MRELWPSNAAPSLVEVLRQRYLSVSFMISTSKIVSRKPVKVPSTYMSESSRLPHRFLQRHWAECCRRKWKHQNSICRWLSFLSEMQIWCTLHALGALSAQHSPYRFFWTHTTAQIRCPCRLNLDSIFPLPELISRSCGSRTCSPLTGEVPFRIYLDIFGKVQSLRNIWESLASPAADLRPLLSVKVTSEKQLSPATDFTSCWEPSNSGLTSQ